MMVTILMATYNGSKYLREQLDSIIDQSYLEWELLIRDDLSQDDTVAVLKAYEARDKRIKILEIDGAHGSATINFSSLFDYAVTHCPSYLMFADQDDIWMKDKVEASLNFIKQEELKQQPGLPIMVYSSFQFMNADGTLLPKAFFMPDKLTLPVLLNENHAYGCTMILNSALISKVKHIPPTAENHDYWVSLVACTFGMAVHLPQKLLYYRQHAHNVSGNVNRSKISFRVHRYIKQIDFLLPVLVRNFEMISLFYFLYKDSFKPSQHALINGYLKSFQKSAVSLIVFMLGNRIRKIGLMQTLAHYYTLMRLRNKIVNHE